MKSRLLAAALTLILHLCAGFAFFEYQLPKTSPLPRTVIVSLSQVAEGIPVETKPQPVAEPASKEQHLSSNDLQSPQAPEAINNESLLLPTPPQTDQLREISARMSKSRAASPPPQTVSLQPLNRPEPGPSLGSDVVPEKPSTPAAVSTYHTVVPAMPKIPKRIEIQPAYKDTPTPTYPVLARRLGYQGTVELKGLVKQDGTVGELQVVTSSGYLVLDQAALNTVQRWSFGPGTGDGVKEAMWIKIPVHFSLK
ncbi:MAG: energy transducer TonB [Desulfobulbaceae bacterium]|nr:energy transducer TonB [Desulfobulbaceae bacterium]